MSYFLKALFVFALVGISHSSVACELTRADVIGAYAFASGSSEFEVFKLNANGAFNSWLHDKPDVSGTWAFHHCTVTITDAHGQISSQFVINKRTQTHLHVTFNSYNEQARFLVLAQD